MPQARGDPFAGRAQHEGAGCEPGSLTVGVSIADGRSVVQGRCVAVYSPLLRHARCLAAPLQRSYRVSIHDDWHAFLEKLDGTHGAIVLCPRLGRDVTLSALAELGSRRPQMPWLLVTDGASDNLRLLVHVRATDVLCWGADDRQIALALRQILDCTELKRLAEWYGKRSRLSPLLRAAIAHLFAQAWGDEEHDDRSPLRSIRDLAERVHCSEDTLSAAARRHGINLRHTIHWVLTLWAIQLHERCGTWETVAWTLDYSSMSGLSDLFLRTVGVRPTALPPRTMAEWCREFERACAPCVRADGECVAAHPPRRDATHDTPT